MAESDQPNAQRIAYLADGRLFLKQGAAEPGEIECVFAEKLKERMSKLHQKNDWRHPRGSPATDALVIGANSEPSGNVGTEIVAIAPGENPGDLLYGLNTDDVAGIFLRPVCRNGDERRLIHTNESNIHALSGPDTDGRVVCSISGIGGLQNLSVYRIGSPGFTEITEGDSLDTAASWIPGEEGHLVYQSAGIGRDGNGQWVETGPASIAQLDTTRGEIRTLLADSQHDYLAPQVTASGQLFCIRRPYKGGMRFGAGNYVLGLLTAPLRLLRALGSWIKPPARPPRTENTPDLGKSILLGNLVDTTEARDAAALRGETHPDIVPKSWQLIQTDLARPSQDAPAIAKGVIAFHVGEGGGVLYSNGSAIFKIAAGGGKPEPVVEAHNVEQIVPL